MRARGSVGKGIDAVLSCVVWNVKFESRYLLFYKKRALDVGKYIKVINIYDLTNNTNQYSKMASIKPGSVFHLLRVSWTFGYKPMLVLTVKTVKSG